MKEHFLVYRTTHIPSGRYYIGRHVTKNVDDGYRGSGVIISQLLKAHSPEEFIREILHEASTGEEMLDLEDARILEVFNDPLCLNKTVGDPRKRGTVRHSELTKIKLSESMTRATQSRTDEHRANISKALTGKKLSEETRKKMSESHKGRKKTPEECQRQSEINHERKSHLVMNQARIGTHHTEESKLKISETKRKNRE